MRPLTAEEIWCAAHGGATPQTGDVELPPRPRAAANGTGWLRLDLTPGADRRALYLAVSDLVSELDATNALDDFFFMHKPPGMRLRLLSSPGRLRFVRQLAESTVAHWQVASLVRRQEYGVYEPGGSAS
jgi:hypothetical protein